MCDDGCCKGIPNDNVPLFVTHLILTLLATTGWILCAAIIHEDWATHLQAWVVFVLGLTVAQTLYGIWASIVDARDPTFYERSTSAFLVADGVFIALNVATAVTGAVYWRQGGDAAEEIFDSIVVVSWLVLGVLGVIAAQDKVKLGGD
mmetsp:Transcript_19937/g.61440  ORF Transcript_19937/g.61440 Transcript_19937/m.61440 type:complete len:148 (+) Transcript_19937:464-907(+)